MFDNEQINKYPNSEKALELLNRADELISSILIIVIPVAGDDNSSLDELAKNAIEWANDVRRVYGLDGIE